jgi:FPC/CPF motif-containing protein YcgG
MDGSVNPFSHPDAVATSNYSRYDGRVLRRRPSGEVAAPIANLVHDSLRALVLSDQFVCAGGKSAFRHDSYGFGFYESLAAPASAAGLARDLCTFIDELSDAEGSFTTFIASVAGPHPPDEAAFEQDLWGTLQHLHDLDAPHHRWDPKVSDDPADPRFSFSFGGRAFFIIGMHAASSRAARRFAWPTLIFNPHQQFERLRENGDYGRFRQMIRAADVRLQGEANPMLADFGSRSEAMQYSGRSVTEAWRCPFHTTPTHDSAKD